MTNHSLKLSIKCLKISSIKLRILSHLSSKRTGLMLEKYHSFQQERKYFWPVIYKSEKFMLGTKKRHPTAIPNINLPLRKENWREDDLDCFDFVLSADFICKFKWWKTNNWMLWVYLKLFLLNLLKRTNYQSNCNDQYIDISIFEWLVSINQN